MHSFSIIIPSYNYANYLGHAIDSLIAQQYPNLEIIIVNDGSTDNTIEVMETYQQRFPGIVKGITQKNGGAGSARNTGVKHASGDYVIFLDSDDQMLPQSLNSLNNLLQSNPDTDAIFAAHHVIRGDAPAERHHAPVVSQDNETNFLNVINKKFPAPTGSYAIKRNILHTVQFSEKITNYEDIIFLAHLVSRHRIIAADSPIVTIHRHNDSLRSRLQHETHSADLLCSILFNPEILPADFLKYEKNYRATHLLRLFRRCIINKDYIHAKTYYHAAIKLSYKNILQLRYLKKYIIACIKQLVTQR